MKAYTAHLRRGAVPVLIAEGFSWGALLFGGLWLLAQRAWIPGVLALAAAVLIGVLTAPPAEPVLEIGLAILLGLTGRDLWRWSLSLRGYVMAHVVTAQSMDVALARLLTLRPDLGPRFLTGGGVP
jgi:Protein of unknown function (DUF2628)